MNRRVTAAKGKKWEIITKKKIGRSVDGRGSQN